MTPDRRPARTAPRSTSTTTLKSTCDGEVTVPFGTLTGCVILEATIPGDLGGPDGFVAEVIAHPEQRIVKWTDSPGFLLLELKEAWK